MMRRIERRIRGKSNPLGELREKVSAREVLDALQLEYLPEELLTPRELFEFMFKVLHKPGSEIPK